MLTTDGLTTDGRTSHLLTALDHIALVVRDLPAATADYSALLGRSPNWHGADAGAEHVWYQLSNMALNIIAPTGTGYTGDRVQAQLDSQGEGIWALAFGTTDMAKTRHTLERRGIASTEARPIRSTHVDTKDHRYWTTSVLAPEATHGTTLFLVEQKPDAVLWPASPTTTEANASVSGLDHVVITTSQPERAVAFYGARLGLEMKLDRTNPAWGSRLMFFKCADLVVEIAHDLKKGVNDGPDHAWGLSWRVPDIAATHARLAAAGFNISDVRNGRKPGTQVFTVRDRNANVPTIILGRV
jgi:catechol 2,3-dioxygenase-like lactoylglutathione lyase family enzyme